jgi:RHS repeat-associated protein
LSNIIGNVSNLLIAKMKRFLQIHTHIVISVLKKNAYYDVRRKNGQGFCCDDAPQNAPMRAPAANDNPELFQYYYHSDHLGSTSLITNLDGEIVQHIEYVPFGEVFIEERNNKWNTPYLFNAKELDEETGLYYYGARYYEPRVSLWYGANPMQEKYPGVSTYAYCHNNPINRIDPDGCADYYALDGTHLGYDDVNDGRVFKVEGSTKFNINDFKDGGKYINNQIGFNEINGKGYAVNEVSMESDLGLLARIGYAEFRGSNNTEQQVGMDITLNRVDDSKFPNTLQEVIEQPKQYSSLNANDPNKKYFDDPASTLVNSKGNLNETNHNAWVKSVSNAIQVLEGDKRGISQGAILYYSPRSMSPANSMPKWNFKLLQENTAQGVRTSHLRFFKYK